MPQPETLAVIERDWAESFGCSIDELRGPGITLLANTADFADYQGAYLLRWESGFAVFTVPAVLLSAVEAAIRGRPVAEVFDRAFLGQLFGERVGRIIGPASRNCADASDFRPMDERGARLLHSADDAALQGLAAACDAEEWEHSAIAFDGPYNFGCFVGDALAAAGTLVSKGPLRNIGIVTHPRYRRQGYGRAVVAAMTAHALAEGTIPHYQTLLANAASLAIARSLDFAQYATAFAIRLNLV